MSATDPSLDPTIDMDDADIARRFLGAGVAVPAERAQGAYAAARRLLEATHWLRKPREASAEPAHVFHLTPIEDATQ
jgi:hypothetical protein